MVAQASPIPFDAAVNHAQQALTNLTALNTRDTLTDAATISAVAHQALTFSDSVRTALSSPEHRPPKLSMDDSIARARALGYPTKIEPPLGSLDPLLTQQTLETVSNWAATAYASTSRRRAPDDIENRRLVAAAFCAAQEALRALCPSIPHTARMISASTRHRMEEAAAQLTPRPLPTTTTNIGEATYTPMASFFFSFACSFNWPCHTQDRPRLTLVTRSSQPENTKNALG